MPLKRCRKRITGDKHVRRGKPVWEIKYESGSSALSFAHDCLLCRLNKIFVLWLVRLRHNMLSEGRCHTVEAHSRPVSRLGSPGHKPNAHRRTRRARISLSKTRDIAFSSGSSSSKMSGSVLRN